jgi:hypothetical protein
MPRYGGMPSKLSLNLLSILVLQGDTERIKHLCVDSIIVQINEVHLFTDLLLDGFLFHLSIHVRVKGVGFRLREIYGITFLLIIFGGNK